MPTAAVPTRRDPARRVAATARDVVTMAPLGIATVAGGARAVERRRAWARRRSRRIGDLPDERVSRPAAVLDAVLGVVLGAVGWFLLFLAVLTSLRGPFYGFVVAGPYDDAWGGPTLAGAWAVHAGVWALTLPALAALFVGLAALQARLSAHLLGGRRRHWVVPVALLVVLVAAFVVRAWLHQT